MATETRVTEVDPDGNVINNRMTKMENGDLMGMLSDYYAECLVKLLTGEPTLVVNKTKDYAEAKVEYGAYMDGRIKVQLRLNKEKPADEVRVIIMPRLYKMKTKMTQADHDNFVALCDDEAPLTKWLDKRGWMFLTVTHWTPLSDVVMFSAVLVPKKKK